MVEPLDEYTKSEGYLEGEEICPVCGEYWLPPNLTDPCITADGERYENIAMTDPDSGPYFCPDCYERAKVEQMKRDNTTLGVYQ